MHVIGGADPHKMGRASMELGSHIHHQRQHHYVASSVALPSSCQ